MVNDETSDGSFPIHIAAENGHIELVDFLLEKNVPGSLDEEKKDERFPYPFNKRYKNDRKFIKKTQYSIRFTNSRGDTCLSNLFYLRMLI